MFLASHDDKVTQQVLFDRLNLGVFLTYNNKVIESAHACYNLQINVYMRLCVREYIYSDYIALNFLPLVLRYDGKMKKN